MGDQTLKQLFDRDGYVVLRGFLDPDELATLHSELARLIREVVPKMPREHVFYEDKSQSGTLKQLQMLHTHDRYFHDLFLGGRIERLSEVLLNDKVVGKNFQYFSKPPGSGQPTPPHQDGYYFKLSPCEALTLWLALDDIDEENGCVSYVAARIISVCANMNGRTCWGSRKKWLTMASPKISNSRSKCTPNPVTCWCITL